MKGRKKSTATRGKAPRQTNEDTVGTSGTRIHDDAVMPENTEEKTAGGVVGNRGKGRTRRDRKSTTTTRESSSGRKGEMVGCGDSAAEIGIENLSMGMKTKKRQLRNRDSKISHNEKDPTSVKCEKDSIVEETKEEQINISSVAEDDFKVKCIVFMCRLLSVRAGRLLISPELPVAHCRCFSSYRYRQWVLLKQAIFFQKRLFL